MVHGITIPPGEMTLGVIGSANRDETVFDEPNELQITRDPNKHLSFGQGFTFVWGHHWRGWKRRLLSPLCCGVCQTYA
jgi:cytochrome P450